MNALNPRHLRLAYLSFFLIESFDCFLYLTLSSQLFTESSILTPPTVFFIRTNATTLFPFILLIFLLRNQHVSGSVGRQVARVFCLFHGVVLILIVVVRMTGSWGLEPFWVGVALHVVWLASGVAALAGF